MITLIPLEIYTNIFYYVFLVITIIVYSQIQNSNSPQNTLNLKPLNTLGLFSLFFILIYMGFRPINGLFFGDMAMYASEFREYAAGMSVEKDSGDIFFSKFMKFCSSFMNPELFFFTCACIYVIPLYIVCKKWFSDYWFYGFFMLVISFSFWAYGTNGIRNGIATSLFLLALSRDKFFWTIALMILAMMIHKSLVLPFGAYLITLFYKNPKHYFYFWILTIPMSLALGSFWEGFFMGLGFGEEDRLAGYLADNQDALDEVVKVGFRWDFLLYSATGVFAGWYYIIKNKFEDKLYLKMYSIYLITNGFWVLIIRANYSNRFAYLSWFMLAIIIIYPLLKKAFLVNQPKILGRIILIYFVFTYVMNVLLAK